MISKWYESNVAVYNIVVAELGRKDEIEKTLDFLSERIFRQCEFDVLQMGCASKVSGGGIDMRKDQRLDYRLQNHHKDER